MELVLRLSSQLIFVLLHAYVIKNTTRNTPLSMRSTSSQMFFFPRRQKIKVLKINNSTSLCSSVVIGNEGRKGWMNINETKKTQEINKIKGPPSQCYPRRRRRFDPSKRLDRPRSLGVAPVFVYKSCCPYSIPEIITRNTITSVRVQIMLSRLKNKHSQ